MECGLQHESKRKQKTLFRAFLDDFERQQFELSEQSKEDLEVHKWTIATLFSIDMVFCYSIIGKPISRVLIDQQKQCKCGHLTWLLLFFL